MKFADSEVEKSHFNIYIETNAQSFCPDKIKIVLDKIFFVPDKIIFVPDKIIFVPDKYILF